MRGVKAILNYKTGVYPFLQLVSITQDVSLWMYSETKCDDQTRTGGIRGLTLVYTQEFL